MKCHSGTSALRLKYCHIGIAQLHELPGGRKQWMLPWQKALARGEAILLFFALVVAMRIFNHFP